jgi:hypothetical protein
MGPYSIGAFGASIPAGRPCASPHQNIDPPQTCSCELQLQGRELQEWAVNYSCVSCRLGRGSYRIYRSYRSYRAMVCVGVWYTKATPPGAGSFSPTPMPGVISNPFAWLYVAPSSRVRRGLCIRSPIAKYMIVLVFSIHVACMLHRGSSLPGSCVLSWFG